MRKFIILIMGLWTSSIVLADWEYASYNGRSETGDYRYIRCHYKTWGGFEFAIVVNKSFCPNSIEFDPETQQWKER